MRNPSRESGIVLIIIIVVITALGLTTAGTAVLADASAPGDPLFGVDKAVEELRVAFSTNEEAKAKKRLEIARERLTEITLLETEDRSIDQAVLETQAAIENADSAVNEVELKFKEEKITLEASDLEALLTELKNLIATHQGLIRRIEIKIKDDKIKAEIKLFEEEEDEIEEMLEDLEEDGDLDELEEEDEELEEIKDELEEGDELEGNDEKEED